MKNKIISAMLAALCVFGCTVNASAYDDNNTIDTSSMSVEDMLSYSGNSGYVVKNVQYIATATEDNVWTINENVECLYSDESIKDFTINIPAPKENVVDIVVANHDYDVESADGNTNIVISRKYIDNSDGASQSLSYTDFDFTYKVAYTDANNIFAEITDDCWNCSVLGVQFDITLPSEANSDIRFANDKARFSYFKDKYEIKGIVNNEIPANEQIILSTPSDNYWKVPTTKSSALWRFVKLHWMSFVVAGVSVLGFLVTLLVIRSRKKNSTAIMTASGEKIDQKNTELKTNNETRNKLVKY